MEERSRPHRTGYSAAVHPYPAAYSPPTTHDTHRRNKLLFRWLIPALVSTYLIIGSTVFYVIVFAYRVSPPDFRVDSFSLSNFTLTDGSRWSLVSDIRFSARNPNRRMSYDHIVAGFYYRSMLLSQTVLAPFSQGKGNTTYLVAKFAVDGEVVEKWVHDGINGEIGKNGTVRFGFGLGSRVSWEDTLRRHGTQVLNVFCRDLAVRSDGRAAGLTHPPCQVEIGEAVKDDN